MQSGDRVLIRQIDGGVDHWLYASVASVWPEEKGALVVVQHPGNPDDGKMRNVKRDDIRTKDDLLPLLEEAKKKPVGEVLRGAGPERKRWVDHYTHQIDALSQ